MACEIKELEFENYGNCLSVSNGMIEAVVTIDVGPRIIYFGFIGRRKCPLQRSEPGIPPRRTNSTGTLRGNANILLTEATASGQVLKECLNPTTRIISL